MRCPDAHERFEPLLDGALPPAEAADLEAHLEECRSCREDFRELEQTVALIREIPRPRAPDGFTGEVLERIPPSPRRRGLVLRLAPLAAAAALLVAATLHFLPRGEERPEPFSVANEPATGDRRADAEWGRDYEQEDGSRLGELAVEGRARDGEEVPPGVREPVDAPPPVPGPSPDREPPPEDSGPSSGEAPPADELAVRRDGPASAPTVPRRAKETDAGGDTGSGGGGQGGGIGLGGGAQGAAYPRAPGEPSREDSGEAAALGKAERRSRPDGAPEESGGEGADSGLVGGRRGNARVQGGPVADCRMVLRCLQPDAAAGTILAELGAERSREPREEPPEGGRPIFEERVLPDALGEPERLYLCLSASEMEHIKEVVGRMRGAVLRRVNGAPTPQKPDRDDGAATAAEAKTGVLEEAGKRTGAASRRRITVELRLQRERAK